MRAFKRTLHALVLVLLSATAANAVNISGYVRNRDGEGLLNTTIRVFAPVNGEVKEIAKTKSRESPRGYYEVDVFPEGLIILAVGYDNDAWQARVVKNISGVSDDDHVINMILLNKQGPLKFLPILEQIHEYKELFHLELAVAGDRTPLSRVQARMRSRFKERILAMPDPRRSDSQPPKQREVIVALRPAQRRILAREMKELFNLYGIDIGSDLRNKRWDTTYREAESEVPTITRLEELDDKDKLTIKQQLDMLRHISENTGSDEDKAEARSRILDLEKVIASSASIVSQKNFVTCKNVDKLEPVGKADRFSPGRVYAFVRVHAPREETLALLWNDDNGKELERQELKVKRNEGRGFRTFSYKTLQETGAYEVRLYNQDRYLIAYRRFIVE